VADGLASISAKNKKELGVALRLHRVSGMEQFKKTTSLVSVSLSSFLPSSL
jgi:hypothetical protein